MNSYLIHLDSRRCIGCQGCAVHCKSNKGLGPGPTLCGVGQTPVKALRGRPRSEFYFHTCRHCEDPQCVVACPTGAMQKRGDGIVLIASGQCTGCLACRKACPWAIPQLDPATGKAVKCDYCRDRVDRGLRPACVSKCTTGALKFVRLVEL